MNACDGVQDCCILQRKTSPMLVPGRDDIQVQALKYAGWNTKFDECQPRNGTNQCPSKASPYDRVIMPTNYIQYWSFYNVLNSNPLGSYYASLNGNPPKFESQNDLWSTWSTTRCPSCL